MLDTIERNPNQEADASIIWMHGLGADGHDFEPIVDALNLPGVRFILPHAPYRAVSINNGYEMRAWFDIFGLDADSPQDETGIRQSRQEIEALIAKEKAKGIAAHRIVLAGFSQGGAIALHTALRHTETLAGVLVLSSWLPLKTRLQQEAHLANRALPVFMAHGTFDSIVPLQTAENSARLLTEAGYPLTWQTYPMAHSVCDREVADIRQFLCSILSI
ncbi:MAG: alpha/beta fold hydrolase [Methylophilaceae bacterium]|jgi:phospholipase/carboxylesterase|nr:alpha/beta fold hydrolase [Methylophilaceae bacterium]